MSDTDTTVIVHACVCVGGQGVTETKRKISCVWGPNSILDPEALAMILTP